MRNAIKNAVKREFKNLRQKKFNEHILKTKQKSHRATEFEQTFISWEERAKFGEKLNEIYQKNKPFLQGLGISGLSGLVSVITINTLFTESFNKNVEGCKKNIQLLKEEVCSFPINDPDWKKVRDDALIFLTNSEQLIDNVDIVRNQLITSSPYIQVFSNKFGDLKKCNQTVYDFHKKLSDLNFEYKRWLNSGGNFEMSPFNHDKFSKIVTTINKNNTLVEEELKAFFKLSAPTVTESELCDIANKIKNSYPHHSLLVDVIIEEQMKRRSISNEVEVQPELPIEHTSSTQNTEIQSIKEQTLISFLLNKIENFVSFLLKVIF